MSEDKEESVKKHAWCDANEAQIEQYRDNLDTQFSNIKLPDEVMNCDQINCFDKSNLHQIDDFGEKYFNVVCQQVTSVPLTGR